MGPGDAGSQGDGIADATDTFEGGSADAVIDDDLVDCADPNCVIDSVCAPAPGDWAEAKGFGEKTIREND